MKAIAKKALSCFLALVVILFSSLRDYPAFANTVIMYSGTWDNEAQGIRLSVYNLVDGYTMRTIDVISPTGEACYNYMRSSINNGVSYRIGKGCKLDYLREYEINGGSPDGIGIISHTPAYQNNVVVIRNNTWYRSFNPIFLEDNPSTDIYVFDANNTFVTEFMAGDALAALNLFHTLGFTFFAEETPQYELLIPEAHVFVVEPIFWFINNMRNDGVVEWVYGSATEWALYSQSVKHLNHTNTYKGNRYTEKGIHSVMGTLTREAGPLCTYSHKGRKFDLGGVDVEIDIVTDDMKRVLRTRGQDIDVADNMIIANFGADYLIPNELFDLAIEIVNKDFRPNTNAMLSFEIESNGTLGFAPAYEDVAAGGDYYGIKLQLRTLPQSDLKLGVVELTCDGLPNGDEVFAPTTYCYGDFFTGYQSGTWIFQLEAYDASGSKIYYDSNSGTRVEDDPDTLSDYIFSVEINDINLYDPPDTTENDLKPAGFTVPDGSVAAYSPRTSATWHYYEARTGIVATTNEDGTEALTEGVVWRKVEREQEISMKGYYPIAYNNVKSAETNRAGELVLRAGYGFGIDGECENSGPLSEGYQTGVVLYPEFGYALYGSILETDGSGGFRMRKNDYSKYKNDTAHSEYSRVHFTPIWYPDGEYVVQVFMIDCWTPNGMLWDCQSYTIQIDGSMYDDWYITRN